MSLPETPVDPATQIQARLDSMDAKLSELSGAVNILGQLIQWIADEAKGIFAMFGSPQMLSMMTQALPAFTQQGVTPDVHPGQPDQPPVPASGPGPADTSGDPGPGPGEGVLGAV